MSTKDQGQTESPDSTKPLLGAVSEQQIAEWKTKAEKWDALDKEISKFYVDVDGEYNEENPERHGDLGDIGEEAARAFGWL